MCGVLLRFRTYYIAILSDIEKAFLQVGIQESERDVTRFLWFKDPTRPDKVNGNLCVYRFCRVPFGIICSPFLLEATLQYHLKQDGSDIASLSVMISMLTICQWGLTQFKRLVRFMRRPKSFLKGHQ